MKPRDFIFPFMLLRCILNCAAPFSLLPEESCRFLKGWFLDQIVIRVSLVGDGSIAWKNRIGHKDIKFF